MRLERIVVASMWWKEICRFAPVIVIDAAPEGRR
jgi:hypothetical protein